jgi:hypothetical protein
MPRDERRSANNEQKSKFMIYIYLVRLALETPDQTIYSSIFYVSSRVSFVLYAVGLRDIGVC